MNVRIANTIIFVFIEVMQVRIILSNVAEYRVIGILNIFKFCLTVCILLCSHWPAPRGIHFEQMGIQKKNPIIMHSIKFLIEIFFVYNEIYRIDQQF